MDQLDTLRLFVAIADRGSLSAVARAWALSPSTVTLALQQLEERLGARLVVRTTRRLSLTAEGERFLGDCRRILGQLDDAMQGLGEGGQLSGEIRITVTNDFGRAQLAPLLDRFLALHPGVRIALVLTDGVVDLVDGGYDIGIRTGPLQDSRLRARRLLAGARRVCAAPAYWRRAGVPRHPRELAAHNCLVLDRPGAPQSNWRFQEAGREFAVKVGGNRTANDGGVLREWAVAGGGVVMKAGWDIGDDLAAGRLQPVLDDFRIDDINLYAVHAAGQRTPHRVAALIEFLAAALEPASPAGGGPLSRADRR
ncbi:LysR family transcriptional regulator [Luteimonas sp. BDR2-5]|uniref:LysR family transcriptional regulator n=1 Tax=Proluteimonas luteida TaxID=2878685 RepID=UPI001E4DD9AF|nr:LysR family transcriptional regulator [Luteimonas sp. BDR2-5]MCD9028290.1 LysR family transcriptional regulator [Luteimonas sp. BDR2-5]